MIVDSRIKLRKQSMIYNLSDFISYSPLIYFFINNIDYTSLDHLLTDDEKDFISNMQEWMDYCQEQTFDTGTLAEKRYKLWKMFDIETNLKSFLSKINIDKIINDKDFYEEHANIESIIIKTVLFDLLDIERVMTSVGSNESIYLKYTKDIEYFIFNNFRDDRIHLIKDESEIESEYANIEIGGNNEKD